CLGRGSHAKVTLTSLWRRSGGWWYTNRSGGYRPRFEALEDKVDARFLHVEQRMDIGFAELRTDFLWVMGAIGGAVITVILAMFAKGWI
ncbi:MAG: hypothetical protein NUW01_13115, partial [Gemmatimonadaceae bacterium]|nr:hypothetical protein [Gemmatimonadaceae bacterium]